MTSACRTLAVVFAGPGFSKIHSTSAIASSVEGQVEDVEVAQASAGSHGDGPVEHDRHALLGETAVRAQGRVEAREIVAGDGRAEDGVTLRDHDEVAHAILGQL